MERDIPRPGSQFKTLLKRYEIGKTMPMTTEVTAMIELKQLEHRYQEWPESTMREIFRRLLHTFSDIQDFRTSEVAEDRINNLRTTAYLVSHLSDPMRKDLVQGIAEYFEEVGDNTNNKPRIEQVRSNYMIFTDYLSEIKQDQE